jgi:N-acetylmuramic acid 6-phosphate etherase
MKTNNLDICETTETFPQKNKYIDKMSTEIATLTMIMSTEKVTRELMNASTFINLAVDKIYNILRQSNTGRLIYTGSGTSGRIGVLDAVELLPTFGWPSSRVNFALAGGIKSLTQSVEGAEDVFKDGFDQIMSLNCSKHDILISLSASGQSQFTIGTVEAAKKTNTFSIGISNNYKTLLRNVCDLYIPILTGGELVAGSTRLNAGTSQKICLNIISTLVMTKLGRVKNGLMIDMIASNKKLKERQKKIEISLISKIK